MTNASFRAIEKKSARTIRTLVAVVTSMVSACAFSSRATAACERLDWSCFDSTVAIVGRGVNDSVTAFCSGVAISPREVLTAGHCGVSLSKPSVNEIEIYREPSVLFDHVPVAYAITSRVRVDAGYNRSSSYYRNDRAVLELDRDLPATLNYPLLASRAGAVRSVGVESKITSALRPGATLHRIGFGERKSSSGELENRRTWLTPRLDEVHDGTLVTDDLFAMPGDSGGPLFLFIPDTGLVLVALHSTFVPGERKVFSPRVF